MRVEYSGHSGSTIVDALQAMPVETVLDGEIVALNEQGSPSFNLLQNYGSSKAPLAYYVFDVLMLHGKSMRQEPLSTRRQTLEGKVLRELEEPIRPGLLRSGCAPLVPEEKTTNLAAWR